MPRAASTAARRHAAEADHGVADDRQQRIEEQRDGGGCGADAAHAQRSERRKRQRQRGQRRHQDAEQRNRRDRLHHVQRAEHGATQSRLAMAEHAERQRDDDCGRASEPSASSRCRRASCANRVAFTAYSRMIDRSSNKPEPSAASAAARNDGQRRDAQHGAGPQARQRVGGEQAERDQHDPEACCRARRARRDCRRASGCPPPLRPRRPAPRCRRERRAAAGADSGRTLRPAAASGQREIQRERGPVGQQVEQCARLARHDAIGLEDDAAAAARARGLPTTLSSTPRRIDAAALGVAHLLNGCRAARCKPWLRR